MGYSFLLFFSFLCFSFLFFSFLFFCLFFGGGGSLPPSPYTCSLVRSTRTCRPVGSNKINDSPAPDRLPPSLTRGGQKGGPQGPPNTTTTTNTHNLYPPLRADGRRSGHRGSAVMFSQVRLRRLGRFTRRDLFWQRRKIDQETNGEIPPEKERPAISVRQASFEVGAPPPSRRVIPVLLGRAANPMIIERP
jgi:hypothetical protein